MKTFKFLILILAFGCIQTDLEDPFPETIRIDNSISEIDFRVSGSYVLKAIYTDDTGDPTDADIMWTSSNEGILTFEGDIATVHEEGIVTISVTYNGISDTHTFETLASRGSLTISGSIPILQVGNSSTFRFNFIDADGKTKNPESALWSSSNENVATIDQNGLVSAVGAGTSILSVTVDGVGQTASLEVTTDEVAIEPQVRLLAFAQFLSVGEQFQFEADYLQSNGTIDESANIAWTSSDASVLSIGDNGLSTGLANGSTTITASANGLNASLEVIIEGENITERSGSLMGTGYDITGDFSLSENEDGDLILTIENYKPDGPGPYFYLTNQDNNVNNGLNLGDANMRGSVVINVSEIDSSVELSTYNFLMVWCEPFNVRLGVGAFEN